MLRKGLKTTLGIDVKELGERWKKEIKKNYWPDIADYKMMRKVLQKD